MTPGKLGQVRPGLSAIADDTIADTTMTDAAMTDDATSEPPDESSRLAEPATPALPALGRKMSFTSAAMVHGAFPPAMNMCDPIINVAMRFEGGRAPAVADVVEQARSLLVFERLRTVPKRVGGGYSFVAPETPARVEDHVRSVAAGADVWAVVDELATAPLRDGATEPPRPLWSSCGSRSTTRRGARRRGRAARAGRRGRRCPRRPTPTRRAARAGAERDRGVGSPPPAPRPRSPRRRRPTRRRATAARRPTRRFSSSGATTRSATASRSSRS